MVVEVKWEWWCGNGDGLEMVVGVVMWYVRFLLTMYHSCL